MSCISSLIATQSILTSPDLSCVKVAKEQGDVSCQESLILNVLYGLQGPHHSHIPDVPVHADSWNTDQQSRINNSAQLLDLMPKFTHNLLYVQDMQLPQENKFWHFWQHSNNKRIHEYFHYKKQTALLCCCAQIKKNISIWSLLQTSEKSSIAYSKCCI